MSVLTDRLEFAPERDAEVFAAAPAAPAVFLLRGEDAQAEPYISKTANLRRRLQRLLGPVEERTKKLNLRDRVRAIEYTPTGSDFESGFLLYRVLREAFPKTYQHRMRFRFAPLVKLHLENEYPRASITTRLGKLNGPVLYYGPFVSRVAAEKFMNDSLDFFKMRRCVDDLHPDPAFPGCVYSEMKMCLAPCFKGCTDSEYHAEVARVQTFFDTSGNSLARELAEQRERASAELAFEEAASIHAKIEKLKAILAQLPEIVRRIDQLAAILVQPNAYPGSVSLFRFFNGGLSGPVQFHVEHTPDQANAVAAPPNRVTQPRSLESRIDETIRGFPLPEAKSSLERMEQLSILKRWYYRSSRTGEIFFADEKGAWPLRQIVRGIGRVYRGEKTQEKVVDVTPDSAL